MAEQANCLDFDALMAITEVLVVRDCRSKYVKTEPYYAAPSTAAAAFNAISATDRVSALRKTDDRFTVSDGSPTSLIDAPLDSNDPLNQIPADDAFELGFELAMMLAAEIVPDPLGHHDVSSILNSIEKRYIKHLKRHRDRYYKELWKDRVALEIAKPPA